MASDGVLFVGVEMGSDAGGCASSGNADLLVEQLRGIVNDRRGKGEGKVGDLKRMGVQFVTSWWGIVSLLCIFSLWLDYGWCFKTTVSCRGSLTEGFLIVASLLLLGSMNLLWVSHVRKERYNRVVSVVDALEALPKVSAAHWRHIQLHDSQLASMVWSFRDGEWTPVPGVLLLSGDLIALPKSCLAPAKVELESPKGVSATSVFQAGSRIELTDQDVAPLDENLRFLQRAVGPSGLFFFRVLETPVLSIVSNYLDDQSAASDQVPGRPTKKQRWFLSSFLRWILLIFVATSFLVNMFRYIFVRDFFSWVHLFLARQAYVSVCIVPLMLPIWEQILNFWGTAKVLALSEQLQNLKRTVSSVSAKIDREERQFLKTKIGRSAKNEVSAFRIARLFLRQWFSVSKYSESGGPISMSHLLGTPLKSDHFLEKLAAVTTFSCLDEQTVLSLFPSVEEIIVLKGERQATVLDLCHGPNNSIHFENPNWQTNLSSLKPIALSCLLGSNPRFQGDSTWLTKRRYSTNTEGTCREAINDLASKLCERSNGGHLADLGRAIGFRNSDLNHYRPCLLAYILDELPNPIPMPRSLMSWSFHSGRAQMTCLIVQELQSVSAMQKNKKRKRNLGVSPEDVTADMNDEGDLPTPPGFVTPQRTRTPSPKKSSLRRARFESFGAGSTDPQRIEVVVTDDAPNFNRSDRSVSHSAHTFSSSSRRSRRKKRRNHDDGRVDVKRTLHLFTWGDPVLVSSCCVEYWGGESIWPLRQEDKESILSIDKRWSAEEFDGVAFAYCPVPSQYTASFLGGDAAGTKSSMEPMHIYLDSEEGKDPSPQEPRSNGTTPASEALRSLLPSQIFTGMVGSREQPRNSLVGLIEDLDGAGVRFVYFSPRSPRRSLVIADKMGLATDWNTAISLRSPHAEPTSKREQFRTVWDEKAKLPHGIEEIRKHIEEVDDVPLRVSTFTDSTPQTTMEMIQILQEYGEIVAAVGTGLNHPNASIFKQANLGVALQAKVLYRNDESSQLNAAERKPMVFSSAVHASSINNEMLAEESVPALMQMELAATFSSLNASLIIQSEASLSIIGDLIGEGRVLIANHRQALHFIIVAQVSLGVICLFSYFLCLPDFLSNAHISWLIWVEIPMLGLPILSQRIESNLMTEMPAKNNEDHAKNTQAIAKRYVFYSFFRLVPTCLVIIVLVTWVLIEVSLNPAHTWDHIFWSDNGQIKLSKSVELVEVSSLFVLVWFFAVHAITFSHRRASIVVAPPTNLYWWTWAVVAMLAQIAYNELYLYSQGVKQSSPLEWLQIVPSRYWIIFFPVAYFHYTTCRVHQKGRSRVLCEIQTTIESFV
uniref:Cation-transporting P-type ATPase C-terminal domain-containing protein n=1 Tax=Mucochytrium quahogii TaxID=96639 RepID=A0A7S2S564_9STRA|mmetsp:Transcript_24251/g.52562  ORF Transcript_24251/g.52562 Transcript_24251/m.52562 type:complete len:1334 (+) Transcript_24251:296-4297(+)